MMAFRIDNRQQWLTALALGAVVVLVFDKLVLKPMIEAWKERSARIATLEQLVSQGRSLLERAESLEGRWQRMEAGAIAAETSVAEDDLLKSVARWARESGITFTSMIPQWKQHEGDYQTLVCRATAHGDLGKVIRFLYELETDATAVRLEECEFASRDARGGQVQLTLRFSGLQLPVQEGNQQ